VEKCTFNINSPKLSSTTIWGLKIKLEMVWQPFEFNEKTRYVACFYFSSLVFEVWIMLELDSVKGLFEI